MSKYTSSKLDSGAQASSNVFESRKHKERPVTNQLKRPRREAHLFIFDDKTFCSDPRSARVLALLALRDLSKQMVENLEYIKDWKRKDAFVPARRSQDGPVVWIKPSVFFTNKTNKAKRLLERIKDRYLTPSHEAASVVDSALEAWSATLANLKLEEGENPSPRTWGRS